ncbi:MAG TPA: hypothetical protein VFI02_08075 [Armatimonadota bacterium]|nr:hypothetical protein [Armatimonadota bacterium]
MIGKIGNIASQGSLFGFLAILNKIEGVDPNMRFMGTLALGAIMMAVSLLSKPVKE